MHTTEGGDCLDLFPLSRLAQQIAVQVLNLRLLVRRIGKTNLHRLVPRWQEGTAIEPNAAVHRGIVQGHIGRQIRILTAQSVTDPGSHAGANKGCFAGVQSEYRLTMRLTLGVQALDEAELVDDACSLRKEF